MNLENIGIGWINWAKSELGIADEKVEILAKVRGEICINCPSIGKQKLLCGECGCGVQAKIRVENEKCPLGKW